MKINPRERKLRRLSDVNKSYNKSSKNYNKKTHPKKKRNLKIYQMRSPPALSLASLKSWY